MAGATVSIARTAVVDIFTGLLALASFLLIFMWKISMYWIILGGAILGVAYKLITG
jgi:hypothetical protein